MSGTRRKSDHSLSASDTRTLVPSGQGGSPGTLGMKKTESPSLMGVEGCSALALPVAAGGARIFNQWTDILLSWSDSLRPDLRRQ